MEPLRWVRAEHRPSRTQTLRVLYGSFPAQPAVQAVVEDGGEAIKVALLAPRLQTAVRASLRWRCALVALPFPVEGRQIIDASVDDPRAAGLSAMEREGAARINLWEMECHEVEVLIG
jgi:hypothetical protein